MQAGISLIFPQDWTERKYSGNLNGPADVILDGLARLHESRFSYQAGVGFIGKPIPDDRSIAVLQSTFPDPEKVIQPLLSDTGKVTSATGWVFISDRSEIIQRVSRSLKKVIPKTYVVQMLETLVDNSLNARLFVAPSNTLKGYATTDVFNRVIDASIADQGAFIGRSWLAVVGEGRPYEQFLGQTEQRNKSTITTDNQVVTDTQYIQTGFKLTYSIASSILTVKITQDSTDDLQYTVETELPRPGLYLIHQSHIKSQKGVFGFPENMHASRTLRRYVWIKYSEIGTLSYGSPTPAVYDPLPSSSKRER